MTKSSIVLGLSFGDEGKGSTTSYLVSKSNNPLVIRHNGGHQAGHTVVFNGKEHVFSTFGSGTLQGAPTFWSKFCTFYPIAVWNEYNDLTKGGLSPELYVDALAPVTTPYDYYANKYEAKKTNHGSVGVGFGSTIKRHEAYYKIYFQDLFNRTVLLAKLDNVKRYYDAQDIIIPHDISDRIKEWINSIDSLIKEGVISPQKSHFPKNISFDHYIFEGAQGILLDMDFGFFPNVTRSNTTSKNALAIIKEFNLPTPNIYYVTRCYQTRHGNGFMTNESIPISLINNEQETNVHCEYQGHFRTAPLDIDLLNYALQCDSNFTTNHELKHLVVTCLDQLPSNEILCSRNGMIETLASPLEIHAKISTTFNSVLHSRSVEGVNFATQFSIAF